MIDALTTSSSALVAQRTRMNVIAGNIANAFSTGQEDGTIAPYRRRVATFSPERTKDGGEGVRVADVIEDASPFRLQYDPDHPHALQEGPNAGYVQFPNVNLTLEYVDAIEAARSYEANVAMLAVTKGMIRKTLQLFA